MEESLDKSVIYYLGDGTKLSTYPVEMYEFVLRVNSSINPVGMLKIRRARENFNISSNKS